MWNCLIGIGKNRYKVWRELPDNQIRLNILHKIQNYKRAFLILPFIMKIEFMGESKFILHSKNANVQWIVSKYSGVNPLRIYLMLFRMGMKKEQEVLEQTASCTSLFVLLIS